MAEFWENDAPVGAGPSAAPTSNFWEQDQPAGASAPAPAIGVGEDVARSMAAAPAKAAIGLAGLPEQLAGWGAQGLGYLTGRDPESFRNQGADRLPSAQAIRSAGDEKVGPLYEPQTPAGKLARTATEWGLMGPRVIPKLEIGR